MGKKDNERRYVHGTADYFTGKKYYVIVKNNVLKVVFLFISNSPGFRQLAVEDQVQIAQESLYPIVLLYHSRSYDLETGEFDWFISTAKERDIILNVLTPFRTM